MPESAAPTGPTAKKQGKKKPTTKKSEKKGKKKGKKGKNSLPGPKPPTKQLRVSKHLTEPPKWKTTVSVSMQRTAC